MSLDVYLYAPQSGPQGSGIFVRDAGTVREITRAEWDERFPGMEPYVTHDDDKRQPIYEANITHNLAEMAREAELYEALWRPDENGYRRAEQLIEPLRYGLKKLQDNPEYFKQFNPENGWGNYDNLVTFVRLYLRACEEWPEATVEVSR